MNVKVTDKQEYLLAIAEERSMRMQAYYAERQRERRRMERQQLCAALRSEIQRLSTQPFSWQVSK